MNYTVKTIKASAVGHVYSGKDGKCCCGCAGKHRYASHAVDLQSGRRGYVVTPDEVNDAQVARVVRILNDPATGPFTLDTDYAPHAWKVVGRRLYIAYLD
jgi:hypothetical protein